MKKILILGGHGDGAVIASALSDLHAIDNRIVPYGFLNDHEKPGNKIAGLPILDKISKAESFLKDKDVYFITALLKVKKSFERSQKIRGLKIPSERYFTLIHPSSTISSISKIGYGTFIGPHVTVMPGSTIGDHCSFRASASIGHDCKIGDFCYMGPNSTISGNVEVKNGAHIGPNTCVIERVCLGSHCVVGAGSTVLKDLSDFVVAFGCPARIIERMNQI